VPQADLPYYAPPSTAQVYAQVDSTTRCGRELGQISAGHKKPGTPDDPVNFAQTGAYPRRAKPCALWRGEPRGLAPAAFWLFVTLW
jgi:hypothetical protein